MEKILVINPGSTSTKLALYDGDTKIASRSIAHSKEEFAECRTLFDQLPIRNAAVEQFVKESLPKGEKLAGVAGRGGMFPGLKTGGYGVNETMKTLILSGKLLAHASNLGALMADNIAAPLGIPAIIYDAVSSDDMMDIAKVTGFPGVRRESYCHVLNMKAVGRKYAESIGRRYEDLSLLMAHLGGGISLAAHRGGKIIDAISDDGGPFSPERAGSTDIHYIIDMCFSGKYTKDDVFKIQRGSGGLKAWLGTSDCREIEQMIANGDEKAKLVYSAEAYQIAKGIGNLAPALFCRPDAIILTGGIANSKMLTGMVEKYVEAIAPVVIIPGEYEMDALDKGMLRILRGEEALMEYTGTEDE